MPDDPLTTASGITHTIISMIYRLTVRLAVEFIKIGTLLAIITFACLTLGMVYFGLVAWAYSSFSQSLVAGGIAGVLGLVLFLVGGAVVQYVVRDLMSLTDLSVVELLKLIIKCGVRRSPREDACQEDKKVN
ncbi:unnamed protein product [Lymnaea stagnalis]|uniref:Phage holin family protein n=1 Tax=Lymnaea stagnalis TaxID=6523 RepID=A0AAV2H5Y6_LYMST